MGMNGPLKVKCQNVQIPYIFAHVFRILVITYERRWAGGRNEWYHSSRRSVNNNTHRKFQGNRTWTQLSSILCQIIIFPCVTNRSYHRGMIGYRVKVPGWPISARGAIRGAYTVEGNPMTALLNELVRAIWAFAAFGLSSRAQLVCPYNKWTHTPRLE